jgi:hypothetical protein
MFNNQRYEHIYGVDALDTAHNFFPEMMYDSHLFPQPTLAWMRHRISSLFPSEYAQQNTMYRLYQSQPRLQMMNAWRNQPTNTLHPPSPIAQQSPSLQAQPSLQPQPSQQSQPPPPMIVTPERTNTTTTPQRQTMAQHLRSLQTPPQLNRRTNEFIPASQLLQPLNASDLTLLNSLLNIGTATQPDITNQFNNILGGLNFVFEDVIVAPTPQQISAGSEITQHSAVPEDINCAICQEHGEPRTWRLLYCHHYFHTNCISRWYEQSVECPVCRADIRMPPTAHATATAAATASSPARTAPVSPAPPS